MGTGQAAAARLLKQQRRWMLSSGAALFCAVA